jgi:predicted glycosyltransferase
VGRSARIALYSHDTQGLGHMRRNLQIARAVADARSGTVLLIAGAREAGAMELPPGVDCLGLPAVSKSVDGSYGSRSLDIPFERLISLRSDTICAALVAFKPDVLIVDKVPLGAEGELEESLQHLRARRVGIVLGLRDVLDDPETVKEELLADRNLDAIRSYYDAVWVYGDPCIYDPALEYGFPSDITDKLRYTGYLGGYVSADSASPRNRKALDGLDLPPGRLALCMVGGGQDGYRIAHEFARADLPPDTNGLILTGPFMPAALRDELIRRSAERERLATLSYVEEPGRLLNMADWVVAMGGYNTVCEILSRAKRALIVPRVVPRTEQLIRAQRMRDLGLLEMLPPDQLSAAALSEWLARDGRPPPDLWERINMAGLACLSALMHEMLKHPSVLSNVAGTTV